MHNTAVAAACQKAFNIVAFKSMCWRRQRQWWWWWQQWWGEKNIFEPIKRMWHWHESIKLRNAKISKKKKILSKIFVCLIDRDSWNVWMIWDKKNVNRISYSFTLSTVSRYNNNNDNDAKCKGNFQFYSSISSYKNENYAKFKWFFFSLIHCCCYTHAFWYDITKASSACTQKYLPFHGTIWKRSY